MDKKHNGLIGGVAMIGLGVTEAIASGGILCPLCIITGLTGIGLIKNNIKNE